MNESSSPNPADDKSKLDFELFLNSIVDYAIIGLDPSGNVSSWNEGAARLKGYAAEEIIGRHFSNFYPQVDREAGLPLDLLRQAELLGHIEHSGWRVRKDGSRFWGDVVISAVRDKTGSLIGFVKVTRDLTERMLADERERLLTIDLEHANQMKSEFLANMSHEVRTPLNGVMGMLTLLLETNLSDSQRDLAATAHRSSRALLRIVNDILDFSKIEAGKLELEAEPFSISHLLDEVSDLFLPQARAKALRIQVLKDEALPDFVIGDAGRLRQVFTNLVGNAMKFTETGAVKLVAAVEAEAEATNEVTIRFDIIDSGIGISVEDRKRLFTSFSQADVSTTRRFGGTGLGLSISQGLVAMMGSEITVESQPGKGSTFSFAVNLGVADVAEAPDKRSTEINDAARVDVKQDETPAIGRILLAEDNDVNQQVAALMLRGLGYDVHVVSNGAEAVHALESETFDAVLMDCQMPVLDGYAATKHIRTMDGPAANTPIIAITASAMPSEREKCIASGMNDFVSKPIFPATLADVLGRVVSANR